MLVFNLTLTETIDFFGQFNNLSKGFSILDTLQQSLFFRCKFNIKIDITTFQVDVHTVDEVHAVDITTSRTKEIAFKQFFVTEQIVLTKTWITALLALVNASIFNDIQESRNRFSQTSIQFITKYTLGNTFICITIFFCTRRINSMGSFVTNKQMFKVSGNILPHRKHKNTVLEVEHGSLNTGLVLNRKIFRSKEFC